MMKCCPKCNGRGTVGYYDVDHFVDVECDQCHGQGEVSETDMTNEEWFCSLPTEEKAEFSMRVFKNCAWCLDGGSPQECPFNEFSEHCPAESKENMMRWLREKHE